ncbi:MAG: sodium:proton antiporter [Desulfurococcaceae archaeon]
MVTMRVDPFTAVFISTSLVAFLAIFMYVLYYLLKSKRVRETTMYLSGEPEEVVSMPVPSVGALYWGFMKRFARSLYKVLVESVHTGSLHDWFRFISSWLGFLMVLLILIYTVYMLVG